MEKAFTETGKVFKNGLNAVQSLNKRVTAYSSGSIGQLQGDANDVLQEYDDEMTKLRSNIRVKQVECASIESQIRTAESDAYEAEQNQIRMQRSSNRAAGVSPSTFYDIRFTSKLIRYFYTASRRRLSRSHRDRLTHSSLPSSWHRGCHSCRNRCYCCYRSWGGRCSRGSVSLRVP